MKQADLDRAVARATNETVAEIKHLGFSLADPLDVALDFDLDEDQFLDWDVTQAARYQENARRPHYEPAAA
jgi:hypothetical protein